MSKRLDVQEHLAKVTRFETIIFWMVSSDARSRVHLHKWFLKTLEQADLAKILIVLNEEYPNLYSYSNLDKVKCVLKFVKKNLTYTRDSLKWKLLDKWQTPNETWDSKTGDCEDGAILVYALCHAIGVPDNQLRIVCADVSGGGHAFVVYRSEYDALEYPIDWCYWYDNSIKMSVPYNRRSDYFFGSMEWFSFNKSGVFKGNKK